MSKRRASISLKRDAAIEAHRVILGNEKLVYVLVAEKKLQYRSGRSSIVYVGTTKNGRARIAQSVATRAARILSFPGVRSFEARIVTCVGRQRVKMWLKLERALLLAFRDLFGEVPRCNLHGAKIRETDEFEYFRKERLRRIVEDIS